MNYSNCRLTIVAPERAKLDSSDWFDKRIDLEKGFSFKWGGQAQEKSLIGTLEALKLGHFKLSNIFTVFYQDPDAEGYDGLLGGSALRNFKVIFDYSRSNMILEPPR